MAHPHDHQHSPTDKKALQNRLRKVAGQIRAIEAMVGDDTDCAEVLAQVVSARKALKSFAEVLIQQHTETCIAKASNPKEGQRRLQELLVVLKRYVE